MRAKPALCDGKHFRAGATRAKRVAFFFLDDATRLGLHVIVGTSESKSLFLRGLYPTLHRYGRPGVVYIDRGAGFIADDTIAVVAAVKSLLIHGRARYPEGHGKIEKFNQTALNAILRNLNGRADVDPSLEALELRLSHWLRETYNHTPHEAFDDKQTPWGNRSIIHPTRRFVTVARACSSKPAVSVGARCARPSSVRRQIAEDVATRARRVL